MKPNVHTIIMVGAVFTSLCLCTAFVLFGPPQLPIWYSFFLPEQQLDQKLFIFIFPVTLAIFTFINLSLAKKVKSLDISLQSIFLYASYIPFVILGMALIHILSVVL